MGGKRLSWYPQDKNLEDELCPGGEFTRSFQQEAFY